MNIKKYKFKHIKYSVLCVLIFSFVFTKTIYSQDGSILNIGDNAPSLVLPSTDNSVQSFAFPYQNKVMLLFFWSSSVSKSKENIYKYKRLYSKYSDLEYKSCDGFDVLSVALQSDKIAWAQDLIKYDLLKMNNCISLKGYNDYFIKAYKIKETPTSFLIDENGKIIAVNPELKTIINYLDERRNVELNPDIQTKISGKIMFGTNPSVPLSNEKIWFINGKNDTIKTSSLDENGRFSLDNINTLTNISIFLMSNAKVGEEQSVFLTSDNGEIISPFVKNEIGYEYTILDVEMPYLKPMFKSGASNANSTKDVGLKDLYFSSQLYKAKETVLSKEAIVNLNTLITKLKSNPKTRVDIISHTDSNGDAKVNSALTLKQSNSIITYLVAKGIVKTRLKAIGKGEEEILNNCKDGSSCSEEEHQKNRRTEFKFYQAQ